MVTNRTPAPVKKSAYEPGQGLFQDFASEGANAKFQNSRGGGQIQSQGGATPY